VGPRYRPGCVGRARWRVQGGDCVIAGECIRAGTFLREKFPIGYIFIKFLPFLPIFQVGNLVWLMDNESGIDRRASATAQIFGAQIRSRRKALKMRQDQLALATGVGRRFLIELEAGKSSCQLGRSLLVAEALGLRAGDILASGARSQSSTAELPELPEEVEEPDGQPTRIL
jgi:DNA-binding XRE family transcriptional regulator